MPNSLPPRSDMQLAGKHLEMLGYTSEVIVRPLLLPEMVERIAAMLNYFLLQLTGPQRKVLKVKDPEKYGFKPRELLGQVRSGGYLFGWFWEMLIAVV